MISKKGFLVVSIGLAVYLLIGCTSDPTLAQAKKLLAQAETHAAEAQSYCGDAHNEWEEAKKVFREDGASAEVKDILEKAQDLTAKCRPPVDAGKKEYGDVRVMRIDKEFRDYAFAKQTLLRSVGGKQHRLAEGTEAWLGDLDQNEAATKETLADVEERLTRIIANEEERAATAEKIAKEHPEVVSSS